MKYKPTAKNYQHTDQVWPKEITIWLSAQSAVDTAQHNLPHDFVV